MLPSAARNLLSSVADSLLPGLWNPCTDGTASENSSNGKTKLLTSLVHWGVKPDQTSKSTEGQSTFPDACGANESDASTPTQAQNASRDPTQSAKCTPITSGVEHSSCTAENQKQDAVQGTSSDSWKNLDWCRWPVCMAYYLEQTCPFGESACPDAHASSDFASVINDKGLVRVCFDALGVGGRMCMRKPGLCRFFHAPAHIRYQLLEIRHGNRLCYRPRVPIDPSSREVIRHVNKSVERSRASIPGSETTQSAENADLTLSVAIVAALVARLLESRISNTPGAAELIMAALCGDPSALRSLQMKVQQQTAMTPYITPSEAASLQAINNYYNY